MMAQREQQALADQINSYKTREAEVTDLATKAASLIANAERLNAQPAAQPARQPSEWDQLYDTDPSYAPVRTRLAEYEKNLKEATDKLSAQQTALERAAGIFAKRLWRDDYKESKERLKGDKYKDWRDPDKLANYAAQRNLLDENGLPSVSRAVEDLTREDEMQRLRDDAKAEGIREGRMQARMAGMERPSSASGPKGANADTALDPTMNFEDLGDKALADPQTRELLAALGEMDPESFRPQ